MSSRIVPPSAPLARRPETSRWGDRGTPVDDRLGISWPQILASVLTVRNREHGQANEWPSGKGVNGRGSYRCVILHRRTPYLGMKQPRIPSGAPERDCLAMSETPRTRWSHHLLNPHMRPGERIGSHRSLSVASTPRRREGGAQVDFSPAGDEAGGLCARSDCLGGFVNA